MGCLVYSYKQTLYNFVYFLQSRLPKLPYKGSLAYLVTVTPVLLVHIYMVRVA
jgi:hypothetical protein